MPLPYLHCFPAPPEVVSNPQMNYHLATLSILLHWYPVMVPLHPQLDSLHSMQAAFAPDHLQSTLQVNEQCHGYSILAQPDDLIVPTAQQLDASASPVLVSCTSQGAVHPASE